MAEIRSLERRDLPAVAALVAAGLPGWRRDVASLRRSLVDHPWTADAPASLVAVEDGVIVGSIGAQSRRLVFDEGERSGVSVSHFVVARHARQRGAGLQLVRQLLAGGQDLTWTDSGTPDVARLWRILGAEVDHARTANWMLILRPAAWGATLVRSLGGRGSRRDSFPIPSLPLQVAGPRVAGGAFPPLPPADVSTRDATPEELAELPPPLIRQARLRVAHDATYLRWTIDHLAALGAPVVRRLVLRGDAPVGSYVYLQRPGVARVVHVAAAHGDVEAVFAAMLGEARARGVAALSGRLEPHLDEPVRRRYAALGLGQLPLVHARDSALRLATTSSASLLSELDLVDSEWW